MFPYLLGLLAIPALLGLYWLGTYNGFVSRRNKAKNAFSSIDIQLKKRWDLIPNLVSTAKGFAAHEKELFESVTKARQQAQDHQENIAERFQAEAVISENLPFLIGLAEDYPDLKSDRHFELLQRNLTEIESQISAARRTYNASVTAYNTMLESAPSNIVAGHHQFKAMDLFSIKTSERRNVSI